MKFKKLAAMMLALSLSFSLAACGDEKTTDTSGSKDVSGESVSGAEESSKSGGGMKIAIVTSPSGVDDGSFNQDVYEGIQKFISENPDATVTAVQETDIANSVNAVSEIVADYDVIVTPGFQFGPVGAIAQDNTEKKFILVDEFATDSENKQIDGLENMYAMKFAEQESGFLAGLAAAFETKTGKVAVVNGSAFPSNVNYQYGFEAGVNYANKKYEKKVEIVEIASYAGTDVTGADVGGNYVGDFNKPETGKVIGSALIEKGCDVIFVAAGNSGNGVFAAAKETENVMIIGCDVDQFDDGAANGRNIILTSALKNMNINVYRQLNAIKEGSFKGGNYTLTAETDSTGIVIEEGRHQMGEETIKALNETYELVKNGTIVPPHNFSEGSTPENFPGLV